MNTSLLVITHDDIGKALVETATSMLGVCPLTIDSLGVTKDHNPDEVHEAACALVEKNGATLVLTDMYGSTPSNIAWRLLAHNHVRVVSGINLPMLIRVLNYPTLDLDELVVKAVSGGCDGVISSQIISDPDLLSRQAE